MVAGGAGGGAGGGSGAAGGGGSGADRVSVAGVEAGFGVGRFAEILGGGSGVRCASRFPSPPPQPMTEVEATAAHNIAMNVLCTTVFNPSSEEFGDSGQRLARRSVDLEHSLVVERGRPAVDDGERGGLERQPANWPHLE